MDELMESISNPPLPFSPWRWTQMELPAKDNTQNKLIVLWLFPTAEGDALIFFTVFFFV